MLTECRPDLFGFAPVEGREVVAAFDAGAITSDAGALLLGATDRAIRMMDRFLARLTRAAATRNPRGITPRPTEIPSLLSQPDIVQAPLASAATADHACKKPTSLPVNLPNHTKLV